MSQVVCYLERAAGGAVFRRIRLVGQGVDRVWNAPDLPQGPAGGDGAEPSRDGPGSVVGATRAGARWVADALSTLGVKRLGTVCVDTDGAVCTWLSAPSADPTVIGAALVHAGADSGDGTGGSGGAGRIIAIGAGGTGGIGPGETSVQALAAVETPERTGVSARLARKNGSAPGPRRQRFAVMAVPDAPVRVFLDALDERGVEVGAVTSLWHAMAAAWDPGLDRAGGGRESPERVVASDAPSAAVLLVDPAGRLIWAWSRGGELIAGGSMRLRVVAWRTRGAAPGDAEQSILDLATTARRLGEPEGEPDSGEAVEFTDAEVGRLAMDWLAWSAQLGHCPQRVVCIGPAALPAGVTDAPPNAATLGQGLARAWPGATVDVADHADPIGLTMARLAGAGPLVGGDAHPAPPPDDPRSALVGLSARPGRVHRRMYLWIAAGVTALAALTGVMGYQFHRVGGMVGDEIEQARAARQEAIESLREAIPGVRDPRAAMDALDAEIRRMRTQANAIRPPRPILAEFARLVDALEEEIATLDAQPTPSPEAPAAPADGAPAATDPPSAPAAPAAPPTRQAMINELGLTALMGYVKLNVPDAETGPRILERLQKSPGQIQWKGTAPSRFASIGGQTRQYILNGLWPDEPVGPGQNR